MPAVLNSLGSTQAQAVYSTVCFVLLEDTGLSLQMTQQNFLDLLQSVYLDWLQKTGMAKQVWTTQMNAGVSQYAIPDEIVRPEAVFYDGKLLPRMGQRELDLHRPQRFNVMDEPQVWHEDGLPLKTIAIIPAAQFQGDPIIEGFGDFQAGTGNLSVVGSERPTSPVLALNTGMNLIPDLFAPYLGYGVLAKIFSGDGELKDENRAIYCATRFAEGVMLANAIAGDDLNAELEQEAFTAV